MKRLKTYVDFVTDNPSVEDYIGDASGLKLEACKWILELRWGSDEIRKLFPNTIHAQDRISMELLFKHFFNITEEDLVGVLI